MQLMNSGCKILESIKILILNRSQKVKVDLSKIGEKNKEKIKAYKDKKNINKINDLVVLLKDELKDTISDVVSFRQIN